MFDLDSFAAGMLAGAALLGLIIGGVETTLWLGKIKNKIAVLEMEFRRLSLTINTLINKAKSIAIKEKRDEDPRMVGQEPAGPA